MLNLFRLINHKTITAFIIFLISFACFIFLLVFNNNFVYKNIYKFNINNIEYNNEIPPPERNLI